MLSLLRDEQVRIGSKNLEIIMTHNDKVMARVLASGLDISASMERDRIVKKIN